jgi:hypothetical protein
VPFVAAAAEPQFRVGGKNVPLIVYEAETCAGFDFAEEYDIQYKFHKICLYQLCRRLSKARPNEGHPYGSKVYVPRLR